MIMPSTGSKGPDDGVVADGLVLSLNMCIRPKCEDPSFLHPHKVETTSKIILRLEGNGHQ